MRLFFYFIDLMYQQYLQIEYTNQNNLSRYQCIGDNSSKLLLYFNTSYKNTPTWEQINISIPSSPSYPKSNIESKHKLDIMTSTTENKVKKCLAPPKQKLRHLNSHLSRDPMNGLLKNNSNSIGQTNILRNCSPRMKTQIPSCRTNCPQSKVMILTPSTTTLAASTSISSIPSLSSLSSQSCSDYSYQNLSSLPVGMLTNISSLISLTLSHNNLTDSHIQLLMSSCLRLKKLDIRGNCNLLLPVSISKMKELRQLAYDWLALTSAQFEDEAVLTVIKMAVMKPQFVTKIGKNVGISFEIYCDKIINGCDQKDNKINRNREILKQKQKIKDHGKDIEFDFILLKKIQQCKWLNNAVKQNMLSYIRKCSIEHKNHESKPTLWQKFQQNIGCNSFCGFNSSEQNPNITIKPISLTPKIQLKPSQVPFEKVKKPTTPSITIISTRDMNPCQGSSELTPTLKHIQSQSMFPSIRSTFIFNARLTQCPSSAYLPPYKNPAKPFHTLLCQFDSNSNSPQLFQQLLNRNHNPNEYNEQGLSGYHLAVMYGQKAAIQFLLSQGGLDLEIGSLGKKESKQNKDNGQFRNILHYAVFLKEYSIAKQLIQCGFPTWKRDGSGSRIMHLVDQNFEFLLLLRKLLKKQTQHFRNLFMHNKVYPTMAPFTYSSYPPRVKQESKLIIVYGKNQQLLEMYEAAVGYGTGSNYHKKIRQRQKQKQKQRQRQRQKIGLNMLRDKEKDKQKEREREKPKDKNKSRTQANIQQKQGKNGNIMSHHGHPKKQQHNQNYIKP